jgi:hypothetical protein
LATLLVAALTALLVLLATLVRIGVILVHLNSLVCRENQRPHAHQCSSPQMDFRARVRLP